MKCYFSVLVPFHHSPVPGNPTPPLTPNSSGSSSGSNAGNGGVGIPFASPASDFGSAGMGSSMDTKSPFYSDVKPGKLSANQGKNISTYSQSYKYFPKILFLCMYIRIKGTY